MLVEDAENVAVKECHFAAAGGNALLLNGYVRNTSVIDSKFSRSGDSAIVALGFADGMDGIVCSR